MNPQAVPAASSPRLGDGWRRRGAVLLSCAILAVIVSVAALSRSSEGRRITAGLGIRTAREPYTALSFATPATLGSAGVHYAGPRVTDRLGFVIANQRHRAMSYSWTVSFLPAWHTQRGSVSVASHRSATVTSRIRLPCNYRIGPSSSKPRNVQVRVTIEPGGNRIDFWQACGG